MLTRPHPKTLHLTRATLTLSIITLAGCASSQPTTSPIPKHTTTAMINGQPVTNTQLWPLLAEIAGDQSLQELTLTRLLDQLATQRNWTITSNDLDHELTALTTIFNQIADPQSTPRLIETIRRRRGLGPVRFDALLRRNAILRRAVPSRESASIQAEIQTETNAAIEQLRKQLNTEPSSTQLDQIRIRSVLVIEQRQMERFAARLLDNADVIVMDRSIKWSRLGEE
ncbi:MAG: hypothetical protein ACSHX5_02930 [Phycisphaerales bacterium]